MGRMAAVFQPLPAGLGKRILPAHVPDRREFDRCEETVEKIENTLEKPAVGSTPSVPIT